MTPAAAPAEFAPVLMAEVITPPTESEPEIAAPLAIMTEAESDLDDGTEFTRHLERRAREVEKVALFQWSDSENRGVITLGKIQAGYGNIFRGDATAFHGRNGTASEEPSFLILKASFRF